MEIYYVMTEAVPNPGNPESKDVGGAYINCFVNAASKEDAIIKVKEYINAENWEFFQVKDIFIAKRDMYTDEPESLECYDEASQYGLGAVFYTWSKEP